MPENWTKILKMEELLKCPFCDKGNIKTIHKPRTSNDNIASTVGGRRFKSFSVSKEKYEVINSCPNCGASAKKID